jgi:hypothetical protein
MAPRKQEDTPRFFEKKDPPPEKTRIVTGTVTDPENKSVEGAVVQLKDMKTLEVRSFLTLADGTYKFQGLSMEIDYELRATHRERSSRTRRLSVFDTRRDVTINLRLEPDA